MLRILADLCVHRDLIAALWQAGFPILDARSCKLHKASDEEIFRYAQKHGCAILSFDKDFGNVVRFDIPSSSGVVLVYIEKMTRKEIIQKTLEFFQDLKNKNLDGFLYLIERDRVRTWPH